MLAKITKKILSEIPPHTKLTIDEIKLLKNNKDFFIGLTDLLSQRFYDIVFGHHATKVIFKEGERSIREESFKRWIVQTFNGEFDDQYWEWQAFVGILHIKRRVKNDMMVTMIGVLTETVIEETVNRLPKEDAIAILKAWNKLSAIISALVVESYSIFYYIAIENVTGISEKLLDNTVKVEIDNIVKQYSNYRM